MVDRVSGARPSSVQPAESRAPEGPRGADSSQNAVDLEKTRRASQAQTRTVKAQDQNLGTIIDIKA
ncbi:MAG TPA: hypothetical protein PKO06_19700 [Candidatus Ozemobacteraceae bacterium]|nr:hypothetical protein [Candidatus Ozemobacteraceae bacterium]